MTSFLGDVKGNHCRPLFGFITSRVNYLRRLQSKSSQPNGSLPLSDVERRFPLQKAGNLSLLALTYRCPKYFVVRSANTKEVSTLPSGMINIDVANSVRLLQQKFPGEIGH